MKRINWKPAAVFVVFVAVICMLAAFGHQLGMSHGALVWCQTVAGIIGAAIMMALPALLKDDDGDGIPDIVESRTTATVVETTTSTEKRS